jgi:hypothetical protein
MTSARERFQRLRGMSRTILVTLLGVVLAAGPLHGEEPAFSLLRAARAEAARQTPPAATRKKMPTGLKWTGIGLVAGGGVVLTAGLLADDAPCPDWTGHEVSCFVHYRKWGSVAIGAAAAGTGGLLLFIGGARTRSMPSVDVQGRRVAWHVRF